MLFIILVISATPTLAELVAFKRSYGGSGFDEAGDIFVDVSGVIYMVGRTDSFGPDPPNAYLSIFNADNSHRCSVAINFASSSERAIALTVVSAKIYMLGETNWGPNPPNIFVSLFDTNCNHITTRIYDFGAL